MQIDIINTKIRRFIVGQFPRARNVGENDPLLSNGLLDSLGILEVVTFVEQEFRITVADKDLLPENFYSVSKLSTFVQSKLNHASPAQ